MSTRANIIIIDEDGGNLPLYVHSDGYPSELGFDLFKWIYDYNGNLKTLFDIDCFIRGLPRCVEDANGIHGDISYLYELEHERYGITCRCYKINGKKDIKNYEEEHFERLSCRMIFFIEPNKIGDPTWFNLDIKNYL